MLANTLPKSPEINLQSTLGTSFWHNLEPWGLPRDSLGPILGRRPQKSQKITQVNPTWASIWHLNCIDVLHLFTSLFEGRVETQTTPSWEPKYRNGVRGEPIASRANRYKIEIEPTSSMLYGYINTQTVYVCICICLIYVVMCFAYYTYIIPVPKPG